jgi:hypothetical protein
MNKPNFNSDNLLVMWYPQYAGGKFIMNCLSLSRHCVPLEAEACQHLLIHPTDYKYRLDKILSTLPPKHKMSQWLSYEFHTGNFYEQNYKSDSNLVHKSTNAVKSLAEHHFMPIISTFKRIHSGMVREAGIDQLILQLIDKNIDFFAESRGNVEVVKQYLLMWPNSKIIKLINFKKFQSLAADKKQPTNRENLLSYYSGNECQEKYESIKGADWPTWEIFEKNDYNVDKVAMQVNIPTEIVTEIKQFYPWHNISNPIFNIDVDDTYFDKDKFFMQMQKLYGWLGYDDFNETLLSKYYTTYIDLHKT